ncbi:MAG: glucose dehydrogenase, partial [Chloroflexota bacterium]|nr:glucose dehydrogenase [Chloroflexota bacterium]
MDSRSRKLFRPASALRPRPAARWLGLLLAGLWALLLPWSVTARDIRPDDVTIAGDFTIEAAATGLAAPTMVAFDDSGAMLIAESGYGGSGTPKVTRLAGDGSREVLVEGGELEVPLTAVAFNDGTTYVVTAGTVWTLADGQLTPLISDLPGLGDHQANQLAFADGKLYLSIGTVTNSAVVGPDNAVFGWLEMPERRDLHEVPCEDITLTGEVFVSEDPLGGGGQVRTSPYSPFGTERPAGTVVPGNVRCNGAVLRANLDGSGLEVVAWGMRNPYGLEVGPDGALYATMHG